MLPHPRQTGHKITRCVFRTDHRVKISGLAICRLGTAHTHPEDLSRGKRRTRRSYRAVIDSEPTNDKKKGNWSLRPLS